MSALSVPSPTAITLATDSAFFRTEQEREMLRQHEQSNPPILIYLLSALIVLGTVISVYAERRRKRTMQ